MIIRPSNCIHLRKRISRTKEICVKCNCVKKEFPDRYEFYLPNGVRYLTRLRKQRRIKQGADVDRTAGN